MQRGHPWGRSREGSKRREGGPLFASCKCPRCGYRMSGQMAVPCSSIPCPQCGTPMR